MRKLIATVTSIALTLGLVSAAASGVAASSTPGVPDESFNTNLNGPSGLGSPGLNNYVYYNGLAYDGSGYLVGGYFDNGPGSGAGGKRVFRVKKDGTLDTTFNNTFTQAYAAATGDVGFENNVKAVAWDGSGYVIGGAYANAPGSGAGDKRMFRVNANGTLDTSFNNNLSEDLAVETSNWGLDGGVTSIEWDGSGYIVGGDFGNGPGTPEDADDRRLFRVNKNGTLDTAFNNSVTAAIGSATGGDGLNDAVYSIVPADNGYVAMGEFSNAPGTGASLRSIFRINKNGSLDNSWNNTFSTQLKDASGNTGLGAEEVQTATWNGSTYLFVTTSDKAPGTGAGQKRAFRAKRDGSLDAAFNNKLSNELAAVTSDAGLNQAAYAAPWDGSGYLIAGRFTNGPGSGTGNKVMFRVNNDGSLDTAFNDALSNGLAPDGLNNRVRSAVYGDNGFVVGGQFTNAPGNDSDGVDRRVLRVATKPWPNPKPQTLKPLKPRAVKVSGNARSAKRTVSWKAPNTANGARPVTGYRLKLNRVGCSTLIVNKRLGKNTRKYTFKRSFLLKKVKCKNSTRGEVVASRFHFRVRVQAINSRGASHVTAKRFIVKR